MIDTLISAWKEAARSYSCLPHPFIRLVMFLFLLLFILLLFEPFLPVSVHIDGAFRTSIDLRSGWLAEAALDVAISVNF